MAHLKNMKNTAQIGGHLGFQDGHHILNVKIFGHLTVFTKYGHTNCKYEPASLNMLVLSLKDQIFS